MNYKEWLKSTEFGLRRRYKVVDVTIKEDGMRIDFTNNFYFEINDEVLKYLWQSDNGFNELCKDIEREFMKQIMNV